MYPQRPMIKQVRMRGKGGVGEFGFTEILKYFFVLKIPEIRIGGKVYNYKPLLLYKYDFYVTSA